MRHAIAFLAGMLIAAPILGASVEGRTITLDDDELQACVAGGGCAIITRAAIERLRRADDCRSRT